MRANKIYRQSHLYTWLAHTLFGLFSSEIQVDTTLATAHSRCLNESATPVRLEIA